jgi:hypothetical protein
MPDDEKSDDGAPATTVGPLGRIYTILEAAKALGMGRTKLEALVRRYPHYTLNGNRKLFNDDDIRELWKVNRIPVPFGGIQPKGGLAEMFAAYSRKPRETGSRNAKRRAK